MVKDYEPSQLPEEPDPEKENPLDNLDQQLGEDLSNEALDKLEEIQGKLDSFKEDVLDKFQDYVVGISLLPPSQEEEAKDNINLMVLIDDSDSEKMSKQELKEKLTKIIGDMAQNVDENMKPDVLLLSELWQMCYDGKYDILQTISMSAPVYDTGMLDAIKIAEVHKNMVLEKFEKYIVCYVLAGSLVQGRATPKSDIDVFIVIDDTDVKRMSRAELKDKLRAIIVGMGMDAGEMTGIKNKLNIQVYILTDFWDNIKEANPIIFTFLRDGVPFYDRGIFMPWKQLLQMGRIKPSPEAIDMYKSTGDKMIKRAQSKLKEIAMDDLFYAALTPSQAALMMYGEAPPTPKETPALLKDIFVEKEDLLEEKYINTMKKLIKTRKRLEHGDVQDISGEEIDDLMEKAENYLERIKSLYDEIEDLKERESIIETYEKVITVARDVLNLEGVEKVSDDNIIEKFEKEVVNAGIIPEKFLRMMKDIKEARNKYEKGELTTSDINKVKKQSKEVIKNLVEHIQRKRGRELEKTKLRVKYDDEKFGEILLLENQAFVTHDVDSEEKEIHKARITEEGSLENIEESSLEEMEQAISNTDLPNRTFIKEPLFEDLKDIFGRDVEVLVNR